MNFLKNKRKLKITFFVSIFLLITSFGSVYINSINIYEDFCLSIYQNNVDVSDEYKITGISFLNRKHELKYYNNSWNNKNWFFKQLLVEKTTKNNYDNIELHFKFNKSDSFILSIPDNEYFIVNSNHKNTSFLKKTNEIFPLNLKSIYDLILIITGLALIYLALKNQKQDKTIHLRMLKATRQIVFLAVISFGIYYRFSNPLDIILSHDYLGHIRPISKFLESASFDHYEWAYPYPIFAITIISIFKNINAICPIQHIISVLSMILFFIYLEKHFNKNKDNFTFQVVYTIAVSFVFYLLAFDGNFIFFEKTLHHEALIIPVSLSVAYVILRYLNNKSILNFSLSTIVLFLSCLLEYRFTVGFISVAFILLILQIKNTKEPKIKKVIINISISLITYLAVFLPEYYLINKYDKLANSFAYTEFVFSNAKAIQKIIEKGKYVDEYFDTTYFAPAIETAIKESKPFYKKILGYEFDYLKYSIILPKLRTYIVTDFKENEYPDSVYHYSRNNPNHINYYNNYFKQWAYLIIKEEPVEVLKKTSKQFMEATIFNNVEYLGYPQEFQITNPIYEKDIQIKYLSNNYKLKTNKIYNLKLPSQLYLHIVSIILKILVLLSFIYLLLRIIKRKINYFLFFISLIVICTIIAISILHNFAILRYLQTILPFALVLILFSITEITQNLTSKTKSFPHNKNS